MTLHAYVGCYTRMGKFSSHRPDGIMLCDVDAQSGRLTVRASFVSQENPSFLRMHPKREHLYAVNELQQGRLSSFALNPANGYLEWLNSQPVDGADPCYLCLDPSGSFVLVANYSSGSLTVFPIRPDGTLAPHSDLVLHSGSGPNRDRQEAPHAHSVAFDPSSHFAIAADLGLDRLLVYRLDPMTGKLALNDPAGAAAYPGAGPRHFTFHPNGKILYCANELTGTVTTYSWDCERGILYPLSSLPTLPETFSDDNTVADIHLNPAATRLYVSNRGHNSLAVFAVAADGGLDSMGQVSCGGNWPRNFAVDPDGKWLFVANQRSEDIVTFRIDGDGMPRETGEKLKLPNPVCIELVIS